MTGWRADNYNETTGLRDNGTTGQRDNETPEKHRHSQAFSGILRHSQSCVAVRYRAWLIREFREIREFRDVRAMPATNQVSDVLPLNRAARSLTSLNSLISLNSLLTARYHHAQQRDCLVSEGRRVLHSAKMPSMGSTKAYVPLTAFFVRGRNRPLITTRAWWEKGCRCVLSQMKVPWDSTKRTAHGTLLLG